MTPVPDTTDTAAPRTSRRVAVGVVTLGAAAAGAPIGVLWAQAAPAIHGAIALTRSGERVQVYLGDEAQNFFVAPFLLLGLLSVWAVVVAALAWQWRPHRGPAMVVGLSVGMAGAAGLAVLVGAQLVHRRYGTVSAGTVDTAPVTPEHRVHYFAEAPPVFFGHTPLQVIATLLVPAAFAALAYALCATWTVRDDLGGYPAVTAGADAPSRRSGL